jgi:hypothetical protein
MNKLCSISNLILKTRTIPEIPKDFVVVVNPPTNGIPTYRYLFNVGDGYQASNQWFVYNTSNYRTGAGLIETNVDPVQTVYKKNGYTGASSSKCSIVLGGSNSLVITATNFSICFWFYCNNTGGVWIMAFQTVNGYKGNFSFTINQYLSSTFTVFDHWDNTNNLDFITLNYNQWYHYAIVADRTNNTFKYYINGVLRNRNSPLNYTSPLGTGDLMMEKCSFGYTYNNGVNNSGPGGYYQDIQFYSYALSQTELTNLASV